MVVGTLQEVDGTKVIAVGMSQIEYKELNDGKPLILEAQGVKVFISCSEDDKELTEALERSNEWVEGDG